MQVSSLNEVKIYSLSCGKSLPEWLSDRKKRALQKKDVDIRRRIELIQDFEMPTVCTTIKVSKDGQYILATVVTFEILSDDYSKIVFLHNDRYIEFHSQSGFYYKTRIPKFGRDFSYHYPSCDLYFVVCSVSVMNFYLDHFVIKLKKIGERTLKSKTRSLPLSCLKDVVAKWLTHVGITSLVLLYDLRSDKPLLVKDHQYGLPIKSVHFQDSLDLILSADSRIIKMWNKNSGKIFTSLEPEHDLNDVCLYPNSGMLLTANETPKMGIYYIPVSNTNKSLTENCEQNPQSLLSGDCVCGLCEQLLLLRLTHLIGSPFLRAYMHGFFMDIRLYHKVKLMVNPFAYEEYRKDRIRQKIEETRAQRKLPKVNKELALKLIEEEEEKQKSTWKKKVKNLPNILTDDRFKVMFENPDFQVDEESEEFRLLNPLVSKISEKRKKKLRLLQQQELHEKEEEEELEGKPSDAESSESSDDEKDWVEEVRKQRRLIQQEEKVKRQERLKEDQQTVLTPQFYEIKAGEEFRSFKDSATKQKLMNKTLEDRLKIEAKNGTLSVSDTTVGSKQLTFTLKRSEQQKKQQEAEKLHRQERKKLRRSAGHLKSRHRRGRPFH
uniref:Nucleolar protein 10 n=1 Tax=Propithecus coquereli TaxID=379532 RepID=A0A2K6GG04_PROCO